MVRRFTLSVDDGLGARIDQWKDKLNLSELFRNVVGAEIDEREGKVKALTEDTDMEAVIARLRDSKEKYESEAYNEGYAEGAMWAKKYAKYKQLKYAAVDFEPFNGDPILKNVTLDFFDDDIPADYKNDDPYDNHELTDAGDQWLNGWLEAVQAIWVEVSKKL